MPRSYDCSEECMSKQDGACESCMIEKRTAVIKKHILSKHSSMLFQKFNELYPDHQTVSPRALSVYMSEDDDSEDVCFYDNIKDSNKVNDLLSLSMTDIETKIVNNILNGSLKLKFDSKLYNCTALEFNNAVENIKSKLSIIGLEEN